MPQHCIKKYAGTCCNIKGFGSFQPFVSIERKALLSPHIFYTRTDDDYWLVNPNSSGKILWKKRSSKDIARSIQQTRVGGFIVAGTTMSGNHDVSMNYGLFDYWILKLGISCKSTVGYDTITACQSYTVPSKDETYFKSGTYLDTIPNAAGCDSIITIHLTIKSIDTTVVKSNGILTAIASGTSYIWLDCDNDYAPVQGGIHRSFEPSASGNYAVALTKNGCTDTSYCYKVVKSGFLENTFQPPAGLYPNPTTGKITLTLGREYKNIRVELRSVTGKLIQSQNRFVVDKIEFNVDNPPGIYLLEVTSESDYALFQLIKN